MESQKILDFCERKGVDSFTVKFLTTSKPEDAERQAKFFQSLSPLSLGKRRLEQTTLYGDEALIKNPDRVKDVECWSFNKNAKELILESSCGSITSYDPCTLPEDWTFYRRGELFFAIISHERDFFLRLSSDDFKDFKNLGIKYVIEK